ncbi:MAG TPA: TlpA disulfide reductase family protein [Gemmataceae bacterium]|nr:TlpA disulfide reductase family protein [Gemmataceae bacterium]
MRIALLSALILAAPALAADEVKLQPVNLDGLLKAVAEHKGKVVVIDVWATFCVPCKEKFPHMVELANKHAKDGVVFISLTVDEPEDKDKALDFLKKNKATFQNFILEDKDKSEKEGDAKLYHSLPPIVHVFDREGKKVKTYEGKKEAAQLDGLLEQMVKKK